MRVRFQNAIQATDHIDIEVSTDNDTWVPAHSHADIQARIFQSTSRYGIGWDRVSGSNTDIDVVFGNKGRQSSNATYAGDGATWAGISSYKWRAVKSSNPLGIGTGLATATQPGAVERYQTTTFELDNGFTGGELTVTCTRIGNVVTISAHGTPTHSSADSVASSAGVVPADYRPTNNMYNGYYHQQDRICLLEVKSDGTVTIFYRDDAGTVNETSTVAPLNISYVIT